MCYSLRMETRLILETRRLLQRTLREEDLPYLVELWTDPEVTRYIGGPREKGNLRDSLRESLENDHTFDLWPLLEKGTDHVVGHCGLIEKSVEEPEEIELVYVLHSSVWGRGYGREIGRALLDYGLRKRALDRIIALIDPENMSSERVALGIGMNLVGTVDRTGGGRKRLYAVDNR